MAYRPYLFFAGDCREAFTRYEEIFGGDLTIMTGADVPGGEPPPGQADLVVHAALAHGDDLLMASDDPEHSGYGPDQRIMVSYDAADADDARRVFDALADGGQVTQELQQTFFSDAFGMCVDRFGTPWMVVAPGPGDQA